MGVIVPGLNKSMKFRPNRAAGARRPPTSQTGPSSSAAPSAVPPSPSAGPSADVDLPSSAGPSTNVASRTKDDMAQSSMPPPATPYRETDVDTSMAPPALLSSPLAQPIPDAQISSLPPAVFGLPPSLQAGPPSPARTLSRAGSVSTSVSGIRASALLGAAANHRASTPGPSHIAHKTLKEIRAASKANAASPSLLNVNNSSDAPTSARDTSAGPVAEPVLTRSSMPPTLASIAPSPTPAFSGLPPALSAGPPSPENTGMASSGIPQTPATQPPAAALSAADIARAAALAVQSITPLNGQPAPPPINLATLKHGRKKVRGRQNAPYGELPKQKYGKLRDPNPPARLAPPEGQESAEQRAGTVLGGLENGSDRPAPSDTSGQAGLSSSRGASRATIRRDSAEIPAMRESMERQKRSRELGSREREEELENTEPTRPKRKKRRIGQMRRADITDDDGNLIPQIGPLTQAQLKYSQVLMRRDPFATSGKIRNVKPRKKPPKNPATQVASLNDVEEGAVIGDAIDEGEATLADLATKLTSGKVSKRGIRLSVHSKETAEQRKYLRQMEVWKKWQADRPVRREMRRVRNDVRQERRDAIAAGQGRPDEEVSDDEENSADELANVEDEPQLLEDDAEAPQRAHASADEDEAAEGAAGQEGADGDPSSSIHREITFDLDDHANEDNDAENDPLLAAGFHIREEDDPQDTGENGDFDFDNYQFGNWAGDTSTLQASREEQRQNARNLDGREIIEEDESTAMVNSMSYSKKTVKTPKWTVEETELFYIAVSQCGECYDLVADFFPGRTRKNIVSKFRFESRVNPEGLLHAIMHRQPLKEDYLAQASGYDPYKPWDREESFYAEAERDARIARGQIIFDAEGNEVDLETGAGGGELGDRDDAEGLHSMEDGAKDDGVQGGERGSEAQGNVEMPGDEVAENDDTGALFLPGGEDDD
nr:Myb DNA-binding like [Naematelia aurantialba]